MALNHGDLSEMNILVDPDTGHITGIIDWVKAKVCPFGIPLWGLENILGNMNARGWHCHLTTTLSELSFGGPLRKLSGASQTKIRRRLNFEDGWLISSVWLLLERRRSGARNGGNTLFHIPRSVLCGSQLSHSSLYGYSYRS